MGVSLSLFFFRILLQHSMVSLFLMLPPCSATTPMLTSHTFSTVSFQAIRKNASLAKEAPLTSSPAFLMDILKLSKRFDCPFPMPSIQLFFVMTLLLTAALLKICCRRTWDACNVNINHYVLLLV